MREMLGGHRGARRRGARRLGGAPDRRPLLRRHPRAAWPATWRPRLRAAGPIAAVRDGDTVVFDVDARELNVELSDEEIRSRLDSYRAPAAAVRVGRARQVRPPRGLGVRGRADQLAGAAGCRRPTGGSFGGDPTTGGAMPTADREDSTGTLYASPEEATKAPPEKFVYVACLYEGTGIDEPDFIAIVDVNPDSDTLAARSSTARRCRTSATSSTTSAGTSAARPATDPTRAPDRARACARRGSTSWTSPTTRASPRSRPR